VAHPHSLRDDERWRESAACRNFAAERFFPQGASGLAVEVIQAAKAVCRSCPVSGPCLQFAMETDQEAGIWGGTEEDERRRLRRAGRAAGRAARAGRATGAPAVPR